MSALKKLSLASVFLAAASVTSTARALTYSDFVILAGGTVQVDSGGLVCDGLIGSNTSSVTINPTSTVQGVMAEGPITIGASSTVNGDVISNDNVTIDAASSVVNVAGKIHSGGNFQLGGTGTINADEINAAGSVTTASSTTVNADIFSGTTTNIGSSALVNGDILAAGNVNINPSAEIKGTISTQANVNAGSQVKVNTPGDINAVGAVTFGALSVIQGTVTHGGLFTPGALTTFGGDVAAVPVVPAPPAPMTFTPVTLPGTSTITPGLADVNFPALSNVDLTPGDYKDLDIGAISSLTLHSGVYQFNTFKIASTSSIYFDITNNNPIVILIAGDTTVNDAEIGSILTTFVQHNGGGYVAVDVGADCSVDPLVEAMAKLVYWEVGGNFHTDSIVKWLGTVNVTGNIEFEAEAHIVGSLYAAGDIRLKSLARIHGAPFTTNGQPPDDEEPPPNGEIPEPVVGLLGMIGLAALTRFATGRSRRAA